MQGWGRLLRVFRRGVRVAAPDADLPGAVQQVHLRELPHVLAGSVVGAGAAAEPEEGERLPDAAPDHLRVRPARLDFQGRQQAPHLGSVRLQPNPAHGVDDHLLQED